MLTTIIKDYLLTNKTVIIPQVGTLTITNEDTLEIMFLSYLKFDDKKLTETHARITGNTIVESKMIVYDWVEQLMQDLDNGKKITIEDLGFFFKNEAGEYAFNSNLSEVEKEIAIVASTPEEVSSTTEIPPQNETFVPTQEELASEENTEKETIEDENSEAQENIGLNEEEASVATTETAKPSKQKRKRKIPLIIGVVLLLAASGIVFFQEQLFAFFETSANTEINLEETNSEEITETDSETTLEQQVEEVENSPEKDTKEEFIPPVEEKNNLNKQEISNTGNYYLIVGAFEEPENAERMLNRLLSEGYKAETVKKGYLEMVSIARFNSLEEAKNKQKEITDSWIFEK